MDLSTLVAIYIRKNRPKHSAELDHFRNKFPNLRETVAAATMAIGPENVVLSHQHRVGKERCAKALDLLLARLPEIEACKNFDELHTLIRSATKPVSRFGVLAVYDTALRIGAKLNLLPEVVYLHSGTAKGAKALGLPTRRRFLTRDELPPAVHDLALHEVEDFFCIYKSKFSRGET